MLELLPALAAILLFAVALTAILAFTAARLGDVQRDSTTEPERSAHNQPPTESPHDTGTRPDTARAGSKVRDTMTTAEQRVRETLADGRLHSLAEIVRQPGLSSADAERALHLLTQNGAVRETHTGVQTLYVLPRDEAVHGASHRASAA